MGVLAEVGSSILLFGLVFGMSATVNVNSMRKQIRNKAALAIGVTMQFVILPLVSFCVVKTFQLPAAVGVTLLVINSSPGGSYSNWWCSVFNAELALSVTMTAVSTLLSMVMLPFNLLIYTRYTYSADVIQSLDFGSLFISLAVVIGGITGGLIASTRAKLLGYSAVFHRRANRFGNVAGIALIALSVTVSSSNSQARLWDQNARFYFGVAMPALIGLGIATALACRADLDKPERVAVAVEACFQNTGIATSVALNMFANDSAQLATAVGVPLFYGMVEFIMLGIFCVTCWRLSWTKAPPNEWIWVVLANSYEKMDDDDEDDDAVVAAAESNEDHSKVPRDLELSEQYANGVAAAAPANSLTVVGTPPHKRDQQSVQWFGDAGNHEDRVISNNSAITLVSDPQHGAIVTDRNGDMQWYEPPLTPPPLPPSASTNRATRAVDLGEPLPVQHRKGDVAMRATDMDTSSRRRGRRRLAFDEESAIAHDVSLDDCAPRSRANTDSSSRSRKSAHDTNEMDTSTSSSSSRIGDTVDGIRARIKARSEGYRRPPTSSSPSARGHQPSVPHADTVDNGAPGDHHQEHDVDDADDHNIIAGHAID